jgi:hypothetical protein
MPVGWITTKGITRSVSNVSKVTQQSAFVTFRDLRIQHRRIVGSNRVDEVLNVRRI